MIHYRSKNRLKISDRLAALAAIVLLLSSVAGPGLFPDSDLSALQAAGTGIENASQAEESITELVGVSPPARAARNFNISSLIFRF